MCNLLHWVCYMWNMINDMWNVTYDMWHGACYTWTGVTKVDSADSGAIGQSAFCRTT